MKMRHCLFVFICCGLFASCYSSYTYYQISETKPDSKTKHVTTTNNMQKYEGSDCDIIYDFWSYGGTSDFLVYNKTDKVLFLNLSKSFFIRNEAAYDLGREKFLTQSSTTFNVASPSVGYGNSGPDMVFNSASKKAIVLESGVEEIDSSLSPMASSSSTVQSNSILAIPPHSYKVINSYPISTQRYVSCDLPSYPSTKTTMNFSEENTPIHFSYYLTYSIDQDTASNSILNGFYVSTVANYPSPEVVDFVERPIPCDNIKEPDETYQTGVYDAVIKEGICNPSSSFYRTKTVSSSHQLFKNRNDYVYQSDLMGYTKTSKGKSKGTLAGALAILGVAIALIVVSGY